MKIGHVCLYLSNNFLTVQVVGHTDRISKTQRIGTTVAFDRNTIQAEEHRAVITPWIDSLTHFLNRTAGEEVADFSQTKRSEKFAV